MSIIQTNDPISREIGDLIVRFQYSPDKEAYLPFATWLVIPAANINKLIGLSLSNFTDMEFSVHSTYLIGHHMVLFRPNTGIFMSGDFKPGFLKTVKTFVKNLDL